MADFLTAYRKTAISEGGYANDPADSGGETWRGVARKKNPGWKGWHIIDEYRHHPLFPKILAELTELQKEVLAIYKSNYWDAVRGDEILHQEIANPLYDSAVNAGVKTAIILAQRALKIKESGKMDAFTLKKLNNKE